MSAYSVAQISISTVDTPTKIVDAADCDRLVLYRATAGPIYWGFDNSVSASTGIQLDSVVATPPIPLPAGHELWSVKSGTGSATIQILVGPQH
jgi:hypothetical protein